MKVAQTLLQFGPLLACLPCRAGRIRPRLLTRAHRSRQERADQARVSSQEPVGESPRTRDRRRHPHRECCDPDLYRRTGSRCCLLPDPKSVVSGKRVYIRVDFGCRRIITKNMVMIAAIDGISNSKDTNIKY